MAKLAATDAPTAVGLAPEDLPHVPAEVKDINDEIELAQEWPPSPPLLAAIAHCQQMLRPAYDIANRLAKGHQDWYERITVFAALAGSSAVIFAIMELTPLELLFERKPKAIAVAEVLAALAAGAAVWWGLRAAFQENWLLERHKAERLRLLKFSALCEPALLTTRAADVGEWRAWFDGQIAEIEQLNKKKMKSWIESDPRVEIPRKWQNLQVTDAVLLDLIKYFQLKRLGVQYNFFTERAKQHRQLNRGTGWLPRLFFYASVVFALLHFILSLAEYYFHFDILARRRLEFLRLVLQQLGMKGEADSLSAIANHVT